jgi:ribonuclease P protein component
LRIVSVKKRSDFQSISAENRKFIVSSFIMLCVPTPDFYKADGQARLGLTVTKKVGNAVVRNRIRRRLREAFRQVANSTKENHDYVLIARKNALLCEYSALIGELEFALSRIHTVRMEKFTAKPRSKKAPKPSA